MVAYCMNDYAIITHGFKDNNIISCIKNGEFGNDWGFRLLILSELSKNKY